MAEKDKRDAKLFYELKKKIRSEMSHAEFNKLRLEPQGGQPEGVLAVPLDYLEAVFGFIDRLESELKNQPRKP